jgi:hypothetical protein
MSRRSPDGSIVGFVKNTHERRMGVLQIKIMFDEANLLREESKITAYADKLAEIEIALGSLHPDRSGEEDQRETMRYAMRLRHVGRSRPAPPAPPQSSLLTASLRQGYYRELHNDHTDVRAALAVISEQRQGIPPPPDWMAKTLEELVFYENRQANMLRAFESILKSGLKMEILGLGDQQYFY